MSLAGPSGGTGGGGFVDSPPENFKVASVFIFAGDSVDGVQMILSGPGGELFELPHHGGLGGTETHIDLDPNEHIIRIDGRFGTVVDSINIHTEERVLSFGGGGGSADYVYEAPPGCEIAGFAGRSGALIDAIGVVLRCPAVTL